MVEKEHRLTAEEYIKSYRESHKNLEISEEQMDNICSSIGEIYDCGEKTPNYYRADLISLLFYVRVLVTYHTESIPNQFKKSFIGNCGGASFPGSTYYSAGNLCTKKGHSFDDIFHKQESISIIGPTPVIAFAIIHFYEKKSNLLGWLELVGAGTVFGVMGAQVIGKMGIYKQI